MAAIRPPRLSGYTLGDRVAEGSNLAWWPAQDRAGREVALRVIDLPESMRQSARTRLERWQRQTHPSLMRVLDLPEPGGRDLVVITERLPGADLAALVHSKGPIDSAQAELLVLHVCGALEVLHATGIIHGDISPRNLLLTTRGWVLIDGTDPVTLTEGTPGFAAPQRTAKRAATAPGDVYALAASVAWALGGGSAGGAAGDKSPASPRGNTPAMLPELDDDLAGLLDAASSIDEAERPTPHQLGAVAKCALARRAGNPDLPRGSWHQLEPEDLALGNLRAMALAAPTRVAQPRRRRSGSRGVSPSGVSGHHPWRSACLLGVLAGFVLTGTGLPEPTALGGPTSRLGVESAELTSASPTSLTPAQHAQAARTLLGQRDLALVSHDQHLLASLTVPGSPARSRDQRLRQALAHTRLIGFASVTHTAMGRSGEAAVLVTQQAHLRIGSQGIQVIPAQPTRCVLPRLVQGSDGRLRISAMDPC